MHKLLTIALLLLSVLLHAQDVIIKTDATEIKCKVAEITDAAIKYRTADNLDGPLYNIQRTDVMMIIYASGKRETYTIPKTTEALPAPEKPKPVTAPVLSKYDSLIKAGKSNKTVGILSVVLSPIAITAGALTIWDAYHEPLYTLPATRALVALGAIQIICGGTLAVLAPVLIVKSKKQIAAAQQYKTSSVIIQPPAPVMLGYNALGIGFTMRF